MTSNDPFEGLPRLEREEDPPEHLAVATALRLAHVLVPYEHDAFVDVAAKMVEHLKMLGWGLRQIEMPEFQDQHGWRVNGPDDAA